jgi:spore germination protein KB
MEQEYINDKEATCLFIAFVIGSSLILGTGGEAENDAWIAGIAGILMATPMLAIYARIIALYQGRNLFEMLNFLFGGVVGRIVSFIYIFYAYHLGAMVLRNFGDFINIVAMPETPMLVPIVLLGLTCIFVARQGIEVLGRLVTYFTPIIFLILVIVQLFAIPQFHLQHIKPVLGNGIQPVIKGGFSAFAFPFAETVLFLGLFSSLKSKKSPSKVFRNGMLIAGFIIVFITVRNIATLGTIRGNYFFPSYAAVSTIKIGDFIQRIEITVSFVFFFGVFFKSSLCLLVASKGIATLFNLKDYRSIVIQTGLLMIYLSYIIYDNSMEMKEWAFNIYSYYAFPMQVVLPIVIWITAEIKAKKDILKGYNIPDS